MKIKFYLYSLLFLSIFSYSQQTTYKNLLDCKECKEIVQLYYQAYNHGITLNSIDFYPMKSLVVQCNKQNFGSCGNKMKEQLSLFMGAQGGPISYGETSIWRLPGNEDFSRFEFDKLEVINNFKKNIAENVIKDCNECKEIVSNFYSLFKSKTTINDNDFKILKEKVENCSSQKFDKCGGEMEKQLITLQGGSGGPLPYGEHSKYLIKSFLGKVLNLNKEFKDYISVNNGDVIFKYKDSFGVRDKNGLVFVFPKYRFINTVLLNNENYFIISDKFKMALFDNSGKETIPFIYSQIIGNAGNNNFLGYVANNKFGVIDKKFNVSEPVYDYMFFRNHFCFIVKDEKYGVLDDMGNVAIEPKYKYTPRTSLNFEYFEPRILSSELGRGPDFFYIPSDKLTVLENDNKYGLINRPKYEEIALPKYETIGYEIITGNFIRGDRFILGKIPVKINGKIGFIDEEGNVLIDCKYDEILGFGIKGYGNEKVSFVKNNNKYGLISNSTGLEITPLKYDNINNGFTSSGITICTINKKKGILNSSGYEVISPRFDEIINFGASETSIVIENGLKGLINIEGSIIINPKYQEIGNFINGNASIKYNNKWGIINSNGIEIIVPIYDYPVEFVDGVANVSYGGKPTKIDTNGQKFVNKFQTSKLSDLTIDGKNLASIIEKVLNETYVEISTSSMVNSMLTGSKTNTQKKINESLQSSKNIVEEWLGGPMTKTQLDEFNAINNKAIASANFSMSIVNELFKSDKSESKTTSSSVKSFGKSTCNDCQGSKYETCSECMGNGKYTCKPCYGSGKLGSTTGMFTCTTCNGSGTQNCRKCYGKGKIGLCRTCSGKGYIN